MGLPLAERLDSRLRGNDGLTLASISCYTVQ
jgi:hypothetical protein